MYAGVIRGYLLNLVVLQKDLLNLLGDKDEFMEDFIVLFLTNCSLCHTEGEGKHGEDGDLSGEGFGGGNANLGTDMDIDSGVGDASDAGTYAIDDAEDECALLLCQFHGCHGVGSFARLGDGHYHIIGFDDGVGIAKLGGVGYLYRDAAEVLDELLADESCVPRGATRNDDDTLGTEELTSVLGNGTQYHTQMIAAIDF